jgi:hypothetical protein
MMKKLFRFTASVFAIFIFSSEAPASDEQFAFSDCVVTAIQPEFTEVSSHYKMGGLCNDIYPFTLSVAWSYPRRWVTETFESDHYGEGYLFARCLNDPVIFDDYCTGASGSGLQTFHKRLVSRDQLTQEQKAVLRQQFENLLPPPLIESPTAREFYGEQYLEGYDHYRIPLRISIPEGGRLAFELLALVADDSGQLSMQEVLSRKANLFWSYITEPYETEILLPPGVYALHATNRSLFMHSLESVVSFTVGDKEKMRAGLSAKALAKQIKIPSELVSTTVNPGKPTMAPTSGTPQISQAAIRPAYSNFTVISPKPDVRYTTAPVLKVFLPARDDVLYVLIQCAGPDQRQPCDHNEGGIAAADLSCVQDDMQCSAEVPFGFEMPLDKAYSLYIRPDSSTDLVEVNFELGAMAEQLTPQPMAKSPTVSRREISRARVATGVVVAGIEQPADSLQAGQPVDLEVWLKNMGAVKSDAGLKYSVVCEVMAGGGECPFKDAAYTVDAQIDPGARFAVKLTGSIATAGTYAITVAAPLPEKGEPFTGNSVTKTLEVVKGKIPIKRTAVKRDPD